MVMCRTLAINLMICCLFTPCALSQELFDVTVFGSFKRMVYTGDATGKIVLTSVPLSTCDHGKLHALHVNSKIMRFPFDTMIQYLNHGFDKGALEKSSQIR